MEIFQSISAEFGAHAVFVALGVMLLGGFIKGVVGFALPMITVSGIGSFMSAEIAVLALLLPSLVTNLLQAFRAGLKNVRLHLNRYWRIFVIMPAVLAISAQVFTLLPEDVLFVILGLIVTAFALFELSGFQIERQDAMPRLEVAAAVASGVSGGLSGVWGPPIMVYLMAKKTLKSEFVQIMGLVFVAGVIVFILSHINSGLLSTTSAPFSALMIAPALLGMWLGTLVQDRLDQEKFRKATLFVLFLAGLNLLRRGLF